MEEQPFKIEYIVYTECDRHYWIPLPCLCTQQSSNPNVTYYNGTNKEVEFENNEINLCVQQNKFGTLAGEFYLNKGQSLWLSPLGNIFIADEEKPATGNWPVMIAKRQEWAFQNHS
jgi:hypothetical protein